MNPRARYVLQAWRPNMLSSAPQGMRQQSKAVSHSKRTQHARKLGPRPLRSFLMPEGGSSTIDMALRTSLERRPSCLLKSKATNAPDQRSTRARAFIATQLALSPYRLKEIQREHWAMYDLDQLRCVQSLSRPPSAQTTTCMSIA